MRGEYDPDEAAADPEVRARVIGSLTPADAHTSGPARAAYVIPILTALLAGFATWLGADVAGDATLAAQQQQIAEARATADRTKRAEVYVRFLDRASDYAYVADDAATCVLAARQGGSSEQAVSTECADEMNAMLTPRSVFQASRNQVFFFGSEAAEQAAGLVAGAVPDAVGLVGPEDYGRVNFDLFEQRYSEFNRVVCRDVQTDPSRRCD